MSIKDLKVYSKAVEAVKDQFAYGELEEHDTTTYSKAFACLPLEKTSKAQKVFLGFEWETAVKRMYNTGRNLWNESYTDISKSFVNSVLKKALSTPIANYLNYREEGGKYLELVSVPATLGYHKKTLLKQFFAQKLNHGFTSSKGCGFHVHIDNEALDEKTILNMIWLLSNPDNREFIAKIAGRDIWSTDWCRPYGLNIKYNAEKPKVLESIGVNVTKSSEGKGFAVTGDSFGWVSIKSICLNTSTSFGTSELRIFSSPQTYKAIAKNLEFTEAMVKFCKNKSLGSVNIFNFEEFIKKKKRRYINLYRFLKLK